MSVNELLLRVITTALLIAGLMWAFFKVLHMYCKGICEEEREGHGQGLDS